MKNYISLFSFLVLSIVGTQTICSQTVQKNTSENTLSAETKTETAAKARCAELKEVLGLSEKQEYAVMKVFRISQPKRDLLEAENANSDEDQKLQAKKNLGYVEDYEAKMLKKILSEKQFDLYLKTY